MTALENVMVGNRRRHQSHRARRLGFATPRRREKITGDRDWRRAVAVRRIDPIRGEEKGARTCPYGISGALEIARRGKTDAQTLHVSLSEHDAGPRFTRASTAALTGVLPNCAIDPRAVC